MAHFFSVLYSVLSFVAAGAVCFLVTPWYYGLPAAIAVYFATGIPRVIYWNMTGQVPRD